MNINNRVYELDGLKKYPIDHGPISERETFSEKFRKIILERIPQQQQKENKLNSQLRKLQTDMNTAINEDIRYSLMAVVPDKRKENLKRLKLLKSKRSMLLDIVENLTKPIKLPEPYETHSYSKYTATLSESKPVEVNVNKLIVKDVNYNDQQLNSTKLTNPLGKPALTNSHTTKDNQSNGLRDQDYLDDDDNSTDTCSDSESRFGEDDSWDEDDRTESLYAFRFVPLREQKEDNSQSNENNGSNVKMNDEDNLKTFTKAELIDFYRDYGFQDLLNMLSKIEQEIGQCDRNIDEETEKRTKFYVDDSRRTHNYNDFITTYLLMITEQKKLNEFVDSKDNKTPVNNCSVDEQLDEDAPIRFFKEILTNYEDVLMNDQQMIVTTDDQNEIESLEMQNLTDNGASNSKPIDNATANASVDASVSSSANTSIINSAIDTPMNNDLDNRLQSKRKCSSRRTARPNGNNSKRKEKVK